MPNRLINCGRKTTTLVYDLPHHGIENREGILIIIKGRYFVALRQGGRDDAGQNP